MNNRLQLTILLIVALAFIPIMIGQEKTALQANTMYSDANNNTCVQLSLQAMYDATQALTLEEQQRLINNIKLYSDLATADYTC